MQSFEIGKWKVDPSQGRIWQPGNQKEKHIRPKLLQVLWLLVEAEGKVVTRRELLQRGWPETLASDESLTRCIADLRRLFEDDGVNARLIETVPKKGYLVRQPKTEPNKPESVGYSKNGQRNDFSIVALPFSTGGGNPHIELLADGLAEEIIEALARRPDLRMISRPSSFRLKTATGFEEMAVQLGVDYILQGSFDDKRGRLQLDLELVDPRSKKVDWSASFSCNLDDVTTLNDKAVVSLTRHLGISSPVKQPSTIEPNPQAYVLMLQGRHLGNLFTAEGWKQSNDHFQRALSIDPDYAVVWAGLAKNYALGACVGVGGAFEEGFTLARAAVNRALEIEPENPFSLAMNGWLHLYGQFDLRASAESFKAALKYEPNNTEILLEATNLASALGKLELAIDISRFVISRDPFNPVAYRNLGLCLRKQGDLDGAIRAFKKALSLSPDLTGGYTQLGFALIEKNERGKALAEINQEPSEAWRLIGLSIVFHAMNKNRESDRSLSELIDQYRRKVAFNVAYIEAFRGNVDDSFTWLEVARKSRDPGLAHLTSEKFLEPLKDDDRWPEFLRHYGQGPKALRAIDFTIDLQH